MLGIKRRPISDRSRDRVDNVKMSYVVPKTHNTQICEEDIDEFAPSSVWLICWFM